MATPESNGSAGNAAVEQKSWKGHALVVPYPGQGHINPMMHLSHLLAAQDILVTFANSQYNHERILRSRASSAQSHSDNDTEGSIRLLGIPDGLGHDEYVVNFDVPKQAQAVIDWEPFLVGLLEEVQPPVTCIIADVFVICTPAIAKRFDIPHVMFWTQSLTSYACHLFFAQNYASLKVYLEKIRSEGRVDERVISCVSGCPTISYKEISSFLLPCDPTDFLFSYIIKNFQIAAQSTFVLVNAFDKLEEESIAHINAPNLRCIGPLLPRRFVLDDNTSSPAGLESIIPTNMGTSLWAEDGEGCLPWLHRQKPSSVLYVSFGSITLMSAPQVIEFAAGLEASGYPFLMVVRAEMMEGASAIAFPEGFVEKMTSSGRAAFVSWAPQLNVLAHPAIGGFFSHAGWNSTLESLCRGVPMLCWPYFADQMLNARCIVDVWKIGLDFVTEKVIVKKKLREDTGSDTIMNADGKSEEVAIVKSEEIDRKIRQLMDPVKSREIRKQMKTVSLAVKTAYQGPSSDNLKSLVELIAK